MIEYSSDPVYETRYQIAHNALSPVSQLWRTHIAQRIEILKDALVDATDKDLTAARIHELRDLLADTDPKRFVRRDAETPDE